MPTQYSHSAADTLCLSVRHLGYPEGRLLLLLGYSVSWGCQVMSRGMFVCAGGNWAWAAGRSGLLPLLPVLPSRVSQCFSTPGGAVVVTRRRLEILCGLYSAELELERLAHLLKLTSPVTLSSSLEGEA